MLGEPFWVCFDHDDDCRRATGSPVAVWVGYRPEQVAIEGNPQCFSRTPGIVRSFCATCGTSIGYSDEGIKSERYFSVGFFDNPERFHPMAHAYWKMKLPWLEFADDLDRIDTYSRERDPRLGYPSERK